MACMHGHPFDESNTYLRANGKRMCKRCRYLATRKRRARLRAEGKRVN